MKERTCSWRVATLESHITVDRSSLMRKKNHIWLAAIAVVLGLPIASQAAGFTPGDIVVERVGNGGAALSSASQAVFLNEYTPTGTLVQSIALPTAVSGATGVD